MNLWNRAFLYIRRKWGKSLLLFCIILFITTFALIGVSIRRATDATELSLRQSLGGSFSLLTKEQDDESGNQPSLLDQEVINQIMSDSGLSDYNAIQYGNAVLKKGDSEEMELIGAELLTEDMEYLKNIVKTKAQTNSEYDLEFLSGALKLVEGRNLANEDSGAAVISKSLADLNGLNIGDEIELSINQWLAEDYPGSVSDTAKLKIIGFFEVVEETEDAGVQPPCNLLANLVLIDPQTSIEFYQNEGYDEADFYAEDPAEIDSIVDSIKDDSSIDTEGFYINKNYSDYLNVSEPLESMSTLTETMLLVLLASGVMILCLILTMYMKGRIYENGVMLSFGIGKSKIILQHVVECMVIALFAFAIASFVSRFTAQKVCDVMLNESIMKSVSQSSASSLQGFEFQVSRITAEIGLSDIALVFGVGTLAVLFSVGISSIPVLTLNPKEILTKME